jgi:hypothetical protein
VAYKQPYSVRFIAFSLGGGLSQPGPSVPADTTWVIRDINVGKHSALGLGVGWELVFNSGAFTYALDGDTQGPSAKYNYHRENRIVLYPDDQLEMLTDIGSDEIDFVISGYALTGVTYPV